MPLKLHLPGNESDPNCCCGDGTDPGIECPDCDAATTGTVTLADATIVGDGIFTFPLAGYDFSGTYALAFPVPPTTGTLGESEIYPFDDKIFYSTLIFSSLIRWFYFGVQCRYYCNEELPTHPFSVLVTLHRYMTPAMPVGTGEPPAPPYPYGGIEAYFGQSGFIECPPVTYDELAFFQGSSTPWFGPQYPSWNVDLELT